MLIEITAWKCKKCERVYLDDKPGACICTGDIIEGNVIGVFEILSKHNGRKFNVTCLLCGLDTTVDTSNIRRQKSCGCKPRHCEVLSSTRDNVRYTCKKCHKTNFQELPVMDWCCDVEDEE